MGSPSPPLGRTPGGRAPNSRLECPLVLPDLEKLVDLQRFETDLKRLETEAALVPERKAELERALAEEKGRLDVAREELAASQKRKRQLEADLQDLEVKRSKYKGQLMEVKTNKEYTALLHEIENSEREIRAREDLVLVEMEKGEELASTIKQEERAFKAAEEKHRGELKALDTTAATLVVQLDKAKVARDALAATIGDEALTLFKRIADRRGVAVAEAKDEMCQVCHLKLRPQMWSELRRNEEIRQCAGCNRILYYDAVPVVAAPEP